MTSGRERHLHHRKHLRAEQRLHERGLATLEPTEDNALKRFSTSFLSRARAASAAALSRSSARSAEPAERFSKLIPLRREGLFRHRKSSYLGPG
jgi:hypothetical protein